MFRTLDTLDIDAMRRIEVMAEDAMLRFGELLLRVIRFYPHFDLLSDHTFVYSYPHEMRRISRAHRICKLTGHRWEVETYDQPSSRFVLKCVRCFPHIDSRQAVFSYAPFTTVERKTD